MTIPFYKYQGTGNDFILIDQRTTKYLTRAHQAIIEQLCDRRFGIGADGLMLLEQREGYDFEMIYFNADGRESSMCGNGGRCITAFAKMLGVVDINAYFLAIDGPHHANVTAVGDWVELQMIDVKSVEYGHDFWIMNTGSPHYVKMKSDLKTLDIHKEGRAIRYGERFAEMGINVNFMQATASGIEVATYERGVEDETFSCGTGVTAAAIAYWSSQKNTALREISIVTKGGNLTVRLEPDGYVGFRNIWLCGPATMVFQGNVSVVD